MESNKEHIRLLFYFHQKKSTADAYRILCETYGKNVIAIKTCTNLNDLKAVNSISVSKNDLDILQLWKKTNCEKMGKSGKYFD